MDTVRNLISSAQSVSSNFKQKTFSTGIDFPVDSMSFENSPCGKKVKDKII